MPSRWVCLLIVLFWLTTTGWLLWHDLWPTWRPGQAPPFAIDPVEEVHKSDPLKTFWTVLRQNRDEPQPSPVFRATTWVDYQQEADTCTLHAQFDATRNSTLKPVYAATVFKIEKMSSKYVVARSGQLRSLEAEVKATLHLERLGKGVSLLGPLLKRQLNQAEKADSSTDTVSFRIDGEVREDRFFAHCRASLPSSPQPLELDLPPTAVSHSGSVLMPLHPVNRITGLRPGQKWRQPLVDPLRDALASLPGFPGGVRELNAHVLPQPQMLAQGDGQTSCLVIEYTNDESQTVARTWVEVESERVQQQEANLEDGRWIMQRDLLSRGSSRLWK